MLYKDEQDILQLLPSRANLYLRSIIQLSERFEYKVFDLKFLK